MSFAKKHLLPSLPILLLVSGFVKGRDADPLEKANQERQLNIQKLKAEITVNFEDAARFERSNLEKAGELLRKNRLLIEDDVLLSERERKAFLDEVNFKLSRVNVLIQKMRVEDIRREEVAAFRKKL
jgi:hypothetical protein